MASPPARQFGFRSSRRGHAARDASRDHALLWLCLATVAFLGAMQTSFGGVFEPRELEIARERLVAGSWLSVPTFGGMPFLEKPPLFTDALALAFRVAGGPSVLAARVLVGLVGLLWLTGVAACAWRAAGRGAAVLAVSLAAFSPQFLTLSRRVALDNLLAAEVTLALAALAAAASSPRGPLRARPWWLFVLAADAAFLTKGLFGTFLVLAPLAAYSLWSRDGRIVRALLRPASWLALCLPIALWAALLYRDGGATYVAEAFLNNSLGRFVGIRYDVAGTLALPYGDVNGDSSSWDYLRSLNAVLGLSLLVVPFLAAALLRRGPRLRGPRMRIAAMALCWAVIPVVVLLFSRQKGTHHLGSCTSGFAVAAALALSARLRPQAGRPPPAWAHTWTTSLALVAPLVFLGSVAVGKPDLLTASLAGALLALVAAWGAAALWRRRHRFEAACGVAAALAGGVLLGYAAHETTVDEGPSRAARWLADELHGEPLAIYRWGDSDLGTFAFVLDRDVAPLGAADDVRAFLARDEPAYCIVRGDAPLLRAEDGAAPPGGVFARVTGGGRRYQILANAPALSRHPAPSTPPPGSWDDG
ncbi:MAG: glycosyltransferase family 39 protein [Planctomycetes bacterium]|nr:glycosyltransferase family 39 protein [Planctomycetota bacterium]